MAKLKLELEPDPGVTIIGISCHEHDYRLCWALNRSTGLSLTRRRPPDGKDGGKEWKDRQEHSTGHSAFDHTEEGSPARCVLVRNHGTDGALLKEHRQADYFLVVDNELAETRPGLLEQVRNADLVLTAFPIAFEQLRAGHKLLDLAT